MAAIPIKRRQHLPEQQDAQQRHGWRATGRVMPPSSDQDHRARLITARGSVRGRRMRLRAVQFQA